jgi:hypothetical protein
MKLLKDILQAQVIDKLKLVVEITNVTDNVLLTCNTSFLIAGSVVKDDNEVEYKITAVVPNVSITVDANGFTGSLHIRKPLLLEGTPKQTNVEYLQISNYSQDNLPLVWLVQNYTENVFGEDDVRSRQVSCTLLFLDSYNEQWINDELNENSMRAMNILSSQFIQAITDNFSTFQMVKNYNRIPRARFGVETSNGAERLIIEDKLSGYEVNVSFDIYKDYDCCDGLSKEPLVCFDGVVNIENSDVSYTATATAPSGGSSTFTLPNTDYNVYVNGVLNNTFSLPTLKDEVININA